ncbi:MAG TPA: PQQ-binding-like beta-propeller repeat protein [Solirubrobacteraceae bacterium]|jgi:outer membrane protein assembly factor BamB|nr:PQQ-binding-like beta-propeller repeat protein [Solirubrobacteraceae bacterium]
MFASLARRVAPVAITLTFALIVAGCGSSSVSSLPRQSRVSAAAPVAASSAGWTSLLDGPSHYATSASVGPGTAKVRWRRALGAPIAAGPVVTASGTAYVAANNGILHAINVRTGRDRWTFDGGGRYGSGDLSTSALILASGEVLWPGPRDRLFALSPAGKLLWTVTADGELTTPVIDQTSHLLVVADMTGHISGYRLGSSTRRPQMQWSRRLTTTSSYGNPVVAADGTIYQTSGDCLFALTPTGRIRWSVTTPSPVEVSPAIATNGIVIFGSNDRLEYGVNPNGHVRWKEKIGNYTYSSPITLPGRRVTFGNHSGQMTILDTDTGHLIRRDIGSGELWTSAAIDAHGDLYFASRSGHIYGFNANGRRLFDFDAGGKFDSYPALAPDGTLLFGDDDGMLFAVHG